MKGFILGRHAGITEGIQHGLGVGKIGSLVFAVSRTSVPIGFWGVALSTVPLGCLQPRNPTLHPRVFGPFDDGQSGNHAAGDVVGHQTTFESPILPEGLVDESAGILEGGLFEQLPVELGHPFEDQGADCNGNFGWSAHRFIGAPNPPSFWIGGHFQ